MHVRRTIATGAIALTSVAGLGMAFAPAAAAASGEQSFRIVDRNVQDDRDARVRAEGLIDARGTAQEGRGDRTRLVFPRGTLIVENDANRVRERCNRRTGEGTITERGTWRVLDGTRRYDDARGRGRYEAQFETENCGTRRAEISSVEIDADGWLRLPNVPEPLRN